MKGLKVAAVRLGYGVLAGLLLPITAKVLYQVDLGMQTPEELFRTFVSVGCVGFNTIVAVIAVDRLTQTLRGLALNLAFVPALVATFATLLARFELDMMMWALGVESLNPDGVEQLLTATFVAVFGTVFLFRFLGPFPSERTTHAV